MNAHETRRRPAPATPIARNARPRRLALVSAFCIAALVACESIDYAPPPAVTADWSRAAARQRVDLATLRRGRVIFAYRCIECHTVPVTSNYKDSDWPCIVRDMAARAGLKPAQRDAVLAYILATRSCQVEKRSPSRHLIRRRGKAAPKK
jgi:hypothetical protein